MSTFERGRAIMFIDNSNIFQNLRTVRPGYRIDYKRLHAKIEELGPVWETYFFAAEIPNSPRETQSAFFDVLQYELNYNVILTELKKRTLHCRECGQRYETFIEKGVDIALGTRLLSLLYNHAFDTAIVVSGDGDYCEVLREVRRLGRKVQVVSFRESLSNELGELSSYRPIFLDDWADDIELARDAPYQSYGDEE